MSEKATGATSIFPVILAGVLGSDFAEGNQQGSLFEQYD
jgi:hypothetical protein